MNKQIENLDPPTICDNCIHDEICGLEGHLEPAMTYCAWKEEKRPQGKWIVIGEEQGAVGIIYKIRKCDKCGWEHSLVIPDDFCPKCGAYMIKEAENE